MLEGGDAWRVRSRGETNWLSYSSQKKGEAPERERGGWENSKNRAAVNLKDLQKRDLKGQLEANRIG